MRDLQDVGEHIFSPEERCGDLLSLLAQCVLNLREAREQASRYGNDIYYQNFNNFSDRLDELSTFYFFLLVSNGVKFYLPLELKGKLNGEISWRDYIDAVEDIRLLLPPNAGLIDIKELVNRVSRTFNAAVVTVQTAEHFKHVHIPGTCFPWSNISRSLTTGPGADSVVGWLAAIYQYLEDELFGAIYPHGLTLFHSSEFERLSTVNIYTDYCNKQFPTYTFSELIYIRFPNEDGSLVSQDNFDNGILKGRLIANRIRNQTDMQFISRHWTNNAESICRSLCPQESD